MALYDFGGIYDYLEDIHFPKAGAGKFPPWVSQPWYYYLLDQQPNMFSFCIPKGRGFNVQGWNYAPFRSIDILLEADTQVPVRLPRAGAASLEAAADRYWQTWDQNDRRDPEFFGRINFTNKFFWKTIDHKFPKWATNLDGLAQSRPTDPNPPIGPYIERAVTDYFTRWNNDSLSYNAVSASIPPTGAGWNPLRQDSFAVPFPPQGLTFRTLAPLLGNGTYWFGPLPPSAWTRFLIFFTQAYCFTYGFGHLDPNEWDLNIWPPRRTSLLIKDGGSGAPPSAKSGRWGGKDPFQDFADHQPELVA